MSRANSTGQAPRRSDGARTHAEILEEAMRLASIEGLGALTVGRLAERAGISKSGLYAHFGSKERLQLEVVEAAAEVFRREVITPGLETPPGLARLEALYEAYLSYIERGVFPGGCLMAGLVSELDAQTGPLHDMMVAGRRQWEGLVRQVIAEAVARGDLDPRIDPEQLVFELDALVDHANFVYVLYRDPTYLARGRTAMKALLSRSRPRRQSPSRSD